MFVVGKAFVAPDISQVSTRRLGGEVNLIQYKLSWPFINSAVDPPTKYSYHHTSIASLNKILQGYKLARFLFDRPSTHTVCESLAGKHHIGDMAHGVMLTAFSTPLWVSTDLYLFLMVTNVSYSFCLLFILLPLLALRLSVPSRSPDGKWFMLTGLETLKEIPLLCIWKSFVVGSHTPTSPSLSTPSPGLNSPRITERGSKDLVWYA